MLDFSEKSFPLHKLPTVIVPCFLRAALKYEWVVPFESDLHCILSGVPPKELLITPMIMTLSRNDVWIVWKSFKWSFHYKILVRLPTIRFAVSHIFDVVDDHDRIDHLLLKSVVYYVNTFVPREVQKVYSCNSSIFRVFSHFSPLNFIINKRKCSGYFLLFQNRILSREG